MNEERRQSGRKRERERGFLLSLLERVKWVMQGNWRSIRCKRKREERTCLTCTWMNIPNEIERRIERDMQGKTERRRICCSPKREDRLEGNWPHEFLSIDISFGVATRESCSSCPFDLLGSIVWMDSRFLPLPIDEYIWQDERVEEDEVKKVIWPDEELWSLVLFERLNILRNDLPCRETERRNRRATN